jgi:hypothetical protein
VDDVLFALRSTASQAGAPDNLLGWGLIDAVGAVDAELALSVRARTRPLASGTENRYGAFR